MERRLSALEQRFIPSPDLERLAIVAPNSWSDQDRELWERAEILHDMAAQDDLIERYSGHRPGRRRGVVSVIEVPAPAWVEAASEAERAAWRARRS